MKIVDIWTLENLSQPKKNPAKEEMRLLNLEATRAIKYAVRRLWPELALELDKLTLEEAKKEMGIE